MKPLVNEYGCTHARERAISNDNGGEEVEEKIYFRAKLIKTSHFNFKLLPNEVVVSLCSAVVVVHFMRRTSFWLNGN